MIRFEFIDEEGNLVENQSDYFILADGSVWRDNYAWFESQAACVSFENFVVKCKNVQWRIVGDSK